jgi:glutamyl-tRNA synthetase
VFSVEACISDLLMFFFSVTVTIKDGPSTPEIKTLPKHKKNPEVGEKQTVYTSTILLEQEDAASFEEQEEVN